MSNPYMEVIKEEINYFIAQHDLDENTIDIDDLAVRIYNDKGDFFDELNNIVSDYIKL